MPAAPDTAITMPLVIFIAAFKMIGIIQRFGDDIPLQRCAIAPIDRHTFIRTPAHTAMVYDDVRSPRSAQGIVAAAAIYHTFSLVPVTQAEPHVTDDDVVAPKAHRVIGNANAIARRGLSGNRGVTTNHQFR